MDSYPDLQNQYTTATWGSVKNYTEDSHGAAHKASPHAGPQQKTGEDGGSGKWEEGGSGKWEEVLAEAALSLLVLMNSADKQE